MNNKPLDGTVSWVQTGTSPLTYTAKLPFELQVGQTVKVFQSKPLQRDPDSPSQIVAAPPMPPTTVFAVQQGATSVAGYAPGLSKVRVELVDGKSVKSQQDVPVDSASSLFTTNFATPLQAHQELQVSSRQGAPPAMHPFASRFRRAVSIGDECTAISRQALNHQTTILSSISRMRTLF